MRKVLYGLIFGSCACALPLTVVAAVQPPMDGFNSAFYTCEGGAFEVAYDSNQPTQATLTTSNNNHTYVLKRKDASSGVTFTDGSVSFWTDGKEVRVEGSQIPLNNCKLKAS